MTLKDESELIKDIVDTRGHEKSSLHYESECIETWIAEANGSYPKLTDYRSEWLNYIVSNPIGEFPYITLSNVTNATVENVVPYAYKSAILKGSTKYRDIDTGEILETFEEGRNLELVSVKMPVLTTSNEDGTKTNILTVNEDVTLRGIGDVQDTLNCLTGEVTQNVNEIVLNGSEKWEEYNTNSVNTYCGVIRNGVITDYKRTVYLNNKLNKLDDSDIDIEGIRINSSKRIFVRLNRDKGITDLTTFKQYLTQNPITVQYQLETEVIKTVDLTVTDQDGNTVSIIRPIEGTMHLSTSGETIKPTFSGEIPVEAITQNLASFIEG